MPGRYISFLLLVFLSWGCGGNPSSNSTEEAADQQSASAQEALEKRRICSSNFEKIYGAHQPSASNISADPQSLLDIMNQWFMGCADFSETSPISDEGLLADSFVEMDFSILNSNTASLIDVYYLRDCLLVKAIADQLTQSAINEQEILQSLFNFTIRNITLDEKLIDPRIVPPEVYQKIDPQQIPRCLTDVLLMGRGTVEDRVWVFSELLRALNYNPMLVGPQENESAFVVVAVPYQDRVALFSPAMGLDFSELSQEDNASLFKEFLADSANLFSLIPDEATVNALQKADWSNKTMFWPFPPIASSPRMAALQLELVGDYSCRVFQEPLKSSGSEELESEGGLTEFLKTYDIDPSTVKVWNYPHQMLTLMTQNDELSSNLRSAMLTVLTQDVLALKSSEDQNQQRTYQATQEKRLLISRLQQLLGQYTDVIPSYMKLRLKNSNLPKDLPPNPQIILQALMVEDVEFWVAISQFQQEDYPVAKGSLTLFLKRHGNSSRWTRSAGELMALSLQRSGEKDQAITVLENTPFAPIEQARKSFLLSQWKPEQPSEPTPQPEPDSDKPTTDKPTTDKPTTDKPTTDKPTTDKPTTDKPTTDKPATDKPTTKESSPPTENKQNEAASE